MVERDRLQALEAALRSVATEIDFGDEPNLVPRIRGVISASRSRAPAIDRLRRGSPAVAAIAAAVVVLVASFPASRHAVASAVGIGGIKIEFTRRGPSTSPGSHEANLFLGHATSLEAARSAVRFHVSVPGTELIGPPDRVYLSSFPPGGRVSLVYKPSNELPEARATGLGALVTEFRSRIKPDFVKKLVSSGASITDTSVDAAHAYWIQGAHFYMYVDAKGEVREDTLRVSSNVLLWEREGVTYRIESALSEEAVLKIARSM